MPRSRPHNVVALLFDGVAPFELGVACEVFGIERRELVDPWYRFKVAAAEGSPVRTTTGFLIETPYGLEALRRADTVVIPAWRTIYEPPPEEALDALRQCHARGGRLITVCSGAFALAHAGLLDGRRATTHWMYTDALSERFPLIDVDPDVLYVDDGDILTSAGTAAGIDLCLHVVRRDHGAAVANAVARRMVVPPHRDGGQAQFVPSPVPACPASDPLAAALDWAVANLHRTFSVEDLARRANMSPRTFARRFPAATGTTPLQWLVRQRVLCAQRMLETTDEAVEQIAVQCGFINPATLRTHFHRVIGTSPLAYRRAFRQKGA
jgi:transcriptional regulator GlxA family with amidase domain